MKQLLRAIIGSNCYLSLHYLKVRVRHYLRLMMGLDPWVRRQLNVPVERHGDWFIFPGHMNVHSVVYSLGIGKDIAFDLSLIQTYDLVVHAFDPTPIALEWLKEQVIPSNFRAHNYAVADYNGTAFFSRSSELGNPSFTYKGDVSTGVLDISAPVHRLETLMTMLGHDHIDLLKIDIEGAEYGVLTDIVNGNIPIKQIIVEFHHRKKGIGVTATKRAIIGLTTNGYELFHISASGQEFAFLRSDSRVIV
jgi:FkbM family methyltransferase